MIHGCPISQFGHCTAQRNAWPVPMHPPGYLATLELGTLALAGFPARAGCQQPPALGDRQPLNSTGPEYFSRGSRLQVTGYSQVSAQVNPAATPTLQRLSPPSILSPRHLLPGVSSLPSFLFTSPHRHTHLFHPPTTSFLCTERGIVGAGNIRDFLSLDSRFSLASASLCLRTTEGISYFPVQSIPTAALIRYPSESNHQRRHRLISRL